MEQRYSYVHAYHYYCYIYTYLILSRFSRPPLHRSSVLYGLVMVLTTNSSPECIQANSSLTYSNSPLKSHLDSKENLALCLLKFLTNNWNKVLNR